LEHACPLLKAFFVLRDFGFSLMQSEVYFDFGEDSCRWILILVLTYWIEKLEAF
jgi:hypothetical protein